jgi:TRAP-type C4-dicarboxylate transport system substrate-binding protein
MVGTSMKKIILITLGLLLGGIANAQTLKIATLAPEASEWMKALRAAGKNIETRTEGRVQIKYYGGGIQGSDDQVLRKMRIGSLQGGVFLPLVLQEAYRDIVLYTLPLVFESEDEATYVRQRLDGRLMEGLNEAGYVGFGFAATGFAIIMSNEPIYVVDDLQGKKVWVPENDAISYAAMKDLALSPQTLPLSDVYTGLQTRLIDIIAASPIGALVMQWHTKVKYITDVPLVYTVGLMAIDKRAFNKIRPDDQVIVSEVMTELYARFDQKNIVDDAGAKQALLNSGIQRIVPEKSAVTELQRVMEETNRRLAENGEYSLELFDEMLSYVDEYRNGKRDTETVAGAASDPEKTLASGD